MTEVTSEPTPQGRRSPHEGRVLLLAPTARDAEASRSVLAAAGVACELCRSLDEVCRELALGAGAVIVHEEAVQSEPGARLARAIAAQPVWSDVPIILLSRGGSESAAVTAATNTLGNVTVVERPVRVSTLVSVARTALRARERQYQVRDHIEEQAQARESLRESEDHYRNAVELNPQVPWTADPAGQILDFSGRWLELTGLTREQAMGEGWARVPHPEDRPTVVGAWAHSVRTGEPYDVEHRIRLADGTYRWMRSRAAPRRDERGHVVRWYGTTEDVHDRKTAELALRQSAERLGLALSAAKLGGWEWDATSDALTLSPRAAEIFGVPADRALTRSRMRDLLHEEDRERARLESERTADGREDYDVEYRVCRPDGTVAWVAATGRGQYDPAGRIVRMIGVVQDVTARKEIERQRQQSLEAERVARAEAERANRLKDEFLSVVSHELRTPLNAILGWSQLLRANPGEADDVREGLEVIERNARAQHQLIEDLLDMSRIISGKVRLDVQRVDLPAVIEAAMESMRPAAAARGVRLQKVLDPLAGPVSGDPARLQQVVWNLLSNAIKFTPKGGRVRVTLERVNSHVEVSVSDTGEGITPDFLPYVFERFRQAEGSTTRRHGGLGLGLSIVKNLVELHGGTVQAKSLGVGQGATFRVALPLTPLRPEEEATRLHPEARGGEADDCDPPRLEGVRVLVVDDEPDARTLLRRLLENCGATVTAVACVDEAVALVRAGRFDVILSDVGMPGRDGYAFARELRSLPAEQGGQTPAVALTAFARSEDRTRAMRAGFDMHVAKPVEPKELCAVVARLAGRGG